MEDARGARLELGGTLALAELDLHVWAIELNADDRVVAACHSLLSDAEKTRAARFFQDRHRRLYTLSHGSLRTLLGSYLKVPPASIQFRSGPAGKPFLADSNAALQFNVSDSGDLALIGLARGGEIGVDVEYVKRMADMESIARHFFSPEECSDLLSLKEDDRAEAFFRCWTRKEAYLKALGDGLAAPLDSFQVTLRANEEPRLLRTALAGGETAHWHMHHLAPAPDYLGAIAYSGAPRRIREWPLITPEDLIP